MLDHDEKEPDEDLLEVANYISENDLFDDLDDDCNQLDTWITNVLDIFEKESKTSYYIQEYI